jgi:hypothetical protein
MHTIFGLNFFVFCILALIVILYFTNEIRNEGFGMSPGTMDQLASTNVPAIVSEPFTAQDKVVDVNRKPDQDINDEIQKNLEKKAIMDMTEPGSFENKYASA